MRKTTTFLSGLALLILGVWLCTFDNVRTVKAQIGPVGGIPTFPPKQPAPSGGGSVTYAYQTTVNTGSWNPTTSASGVAIGTAAANRWVIVYIYSGFNPVTAVNANGTINFTQAILDSTNNDMAIWYGNVPTGTTATLNFTASGAVFFSQIWVATISGTTQSAPSSTPDFPAATPPGTMTLVVPTGGVGTAFFSNDDGAPGTFTGVTSDATGATQNLGHTTTAGSQAVTYSVSAVHAQGVGLTWGP